MNNIIKRTWNQNRMVNIEDLRGMAFQAEDGGHTFEISGINDAEESVELSGTVAGVFMRPDGTDVALTGTASDGVVSVTLSDACYAVNGRFGLYIFVTSDSKKTCVYACIGTVAQTSYGTVAGDTPQNVVDLINAINAAIASIPADYTDLLDSIAPSFSDSTAYTSGTIVWYNGLLYQFTADKAAGSWDASKVRQTSVATAQLDAGDISYDPDETYPDGTVGAALGQKANVDGYYDQLTAGHAKQLLSTVGINDQTPYNFRPSGGTLDVGDTMDVNAIVGGTVAWNQLVRSTDTSCTVQSGHKYFKRIGGVDSIAISDGTSFAVSGSDNVIDLTRLLGSNIADYIYNIEQTTAGAGVAWVRKYFPKLFYQYNPGSLESVRVSQHKMVGLNVFDKSEAIYESYINNDTGEEINATGAVCTGFIRVIPNLTYFINSDATSGNWGAWYDADKNYISGISGKGLKTSPSNAQYMRMSIKRNSSSTGNPDTFCINLSWDGEKDGTYEPYQEWVYPLDSSLTLRGIPKLDDSGNLYYDGDRYLPDGTVERRYGIVDLGTLNWSRYSTSNIPVFYATINGMKSGYAALQCAKYLSQLWTALMNREDMTIQAHPTLNIVYVADAAYTDAAAFKTAMSGVMLVCELATPTTETAEPYAKTQSLDNFGTEGFTDAAVEAGTRDVSIPVGHETFFQQDLRAKVETAPNPPDGDGTYVMRQTGGGNEYVPLIIPAELPTAPSANGTYTLRCTVTDGTAFYSWVSD